MRVLRWGAVLLAVIGCRPLAPGETRCTTSTVYGTTFTNCKTGPQPVQYVQLPPAPPPQQPIVGTALVRWWCVTYSSGRLGSCNRLQGWCEKNREHAANADPTTSACQPQRTADCFGIAFAGQPGTDDMCQPHREACVYQRDLVTKRPDLGTVLTECRTID